MHPFFQVLAESLRTAHLSDDEAPARILFRVLGLDEERYAVELTRESCSVETVSAASRRPADLVVFCDRRQLDLMLERGLSDRALRYEGRRELLDRLAELATPPESPLGARAKALGGDR